MQSQLAVSTPESLPLPSLIAGAGKRASWRFLEFFTVDISNLHTRTAYARAAGEFWRWYEGRGILELGQVKPTNVAGGIEELQGKRSAPTMKQHLACVRMLFDLLVTGQVVPANPAHAARDGDRIEVAQRMAGHANAKTTDLYDRRSDDISVSEVERVGS